MPSFLLTLITFIFVFGASVAFHEFGHLFFAKRAGILVREYAVGMGPKLFAHRGKDGTLYTIRMIPLGGYVRMAGWGEDTTEIKKGQAASLVLNEAEIVTRVNLSERVELENAIPMNVTDYDFDDTKNLCIEGESFGETKRYAVLHDATIIEEDGTELRIAPKDVQYQSASVPGKILTNFAGPLNNFILGFVAFLVMILMQGGAPTNSNQLGQIVANSPAMTAGLKTGDKVISINGKTVNNWNDMVNDITGSNGGKLTFDIQRGNTQKSLTLAPQKENGSYKVGIGQHISTSPMDIVMGSFQETWGAMTMIGNALRNLIAHPNLNKLGGPVAVYQMSGEAAKEGLVAVFYFLAFLSINLGIMNLIPIPALDGGKILINIIEAIRRKPLKQETESIVTLVGVAFMVVLLIAVTGNDILRYFMH